MDCQCCCAVGAHAKAVALPEDDTALNFLRQFFDLSRRRGREKRGGVGGGGRTTESLISLHPFFFFVYGGVFPAPLLPKLSLSGFVCLSAVESCMGERGMVGMLFFSCNSTVYRTANTAL